jgi:serine phosphatase RsbU (regulator of sigma subunit)
MYNSNMNSKTNKTVKYPFKLKITLANFVLVLLFLLTYVGITVNQNQKEKEEYLFDSIYNFTKGMTATVQNDFQLVATLSSMLIQLVETIDEGSLKSTLSTLPMIKGFQSYKMVSGQIYRVRSTGKDFSIPDALLATSFAKDQVDEFTALEGNSSYVWITCRKNISTCNLIYADFQFAIGAVDEDFAKFEYIIVDNERRSIMKSFDHEGTNLTKLLPEFNKMKFGDDYAINEFNINSEKFLVSKTNLEIGPATLYVVSPLKSLAVQIKRVVTDSLGVAGILLGLSLVLSVILSTLFTKALNVLMDGVNVVSTGNYDIQVQSTTNDEFNLLTSTFNSMVRRIKENIIQLEKSFRMEQEIKLASLLQDSFMPSGGFEDSHLKISGYYKPATECAGDMWGFQPTPDKFIFFIGDVTGHGLSSAIVTAASSSVFTLMQDIAKNDQTIYTDPGKIFYFLNKVISEIGGGKLMMTCFVGIYDIPKKKLYFSNSSHDYPIIIKNSGEITPIMSKTDFRLGEKPDPVFQSNEMDLLPGDKILLYTDGLVENKNPQGKNFSEGELFRLIKRQKTKLTMDVVLGAYTNILQESIPQDDLTVVLLEVK